MSISNIIRFIAMLVAFLQLLFVNVSYGTEINPIEEPIEQPALVNNIEGDSTMSDTVLYAADAINAVQGIYTDGSRSAYEMSNRSASLTHDLKDSKTATLKNSKGVAYIEDSFDTYYTLKDGKTYYSCDSVTDGRVNTIRLGEYYYETHVRDLNYNRLTNGKFKADKAYHIYADRLYSELSLYASEATEDLDEFGSEIVIPSSKVKAVLIKDGSGLHDTPDGVDAQSVEYAAFDIDGAGIVGFIVPSDGSTKYLSVTKSKDNYIIRQAAAYESGTGINKNDETGGYELNRVCFGFRIYTDETHSFDSFIHEAYLERNPLEGITVEAGNSNAAYIGYEYLRGTYKLVIDGTDFQTAYDNPDKRFFAPITVKCDGYDRDILFRSNGKSGCLEAAALLDDTGTLAPIPVQVCKNFQGDGGEGYYSVIDYMYGDSFFPLSLNADEQISFTLLNLYQNWGKYPLKQLSSIEFFISYYHLSTGTTESNCIAPYYVSGKDGWLLPDFRGRSGQMWSGQPQFNSVGRLYFVKYDKSSRSEVLGEYTGAKINSTGLNYSDIENYYTSDCGSYDFTLRHTEMPQTDENRTYYTVDINFKRDINFKNFKRDFSFFQFDGRFVSFDKIGWLSENNTPETSDITLKSGGTEYITLGSDCPYFGYFDIADKDRGNIDSGFGSNFALIVKDSEIISCGQKLNSAFVFRNEFSDGLNLGSLTLNEKELSFKAGDSVTLELVLLPWGTGREEEDTNVLTVREDSALKPLTLSAITGTAGSDNSFVPEITCVNNSAEFTVTGGRNHCSVRVNGFTCGKGIRVYELTGTEYTEIQLASVHGYDGYTVYYDRLTGLYSYSFVYNSDSPDTVRHFKVTGIE